MNEWMPSDTGEISPVLTKRRALNGSVLSPNASTILDQVIAHKKKVALGKPQKK